MSNQPETTVEAILDANEPESGRRRIIAGAAAALVGGTAAGAVLAPGIAGADVPPGSVMLESLNDEVKDPAPEVAGARSLGPGPTQAAPGDTVSDLTTSIPIAQDGDLWLAVTAVQGPSVQGGTVRRAQSISFPWTYTNTATPTDPALGTALLVRWDVDVANSPARVQTDTTLGPRPVINQEGTLTYFSDTGLFSLAPVGYGDLTEIRNNSGSNRTLTPSWTFMSCRFVTADGAVVRLERNDTNRGGAAFVDTPVFATVNGGSIDGMNVWSSAGQQGFEQTTLFSQLHLSGDIEMERRTAVDVAGANLHDSGAILHEDIGIRLQHKTEADHNIGVLNASGTVNTPLTVELFSPVDPLPITATNLHLTSSAPLALSGEPTIPAGLEGQEISITNVGTHPISLRNSTTGSATNLALGAETRSVGQDHTINLCYRDGIWHEIQDGASWLSSHFTPGFGGVRIVRIETEPGASTGQFSIQSQGASFPSATLNGDGLILSDGADIVAATRIHRAQSGTVRVGGAFTNDLHTLLAQVAYTPANSAHWTTTPANMAEALDQIAERLASLE